MSFTLGLTRDSILNPTRLDQYEIEAAMLWPESESAREVSICAAMTEYSIDHLPEMPAEVLHHLRDHLKSGAPRIKDLQSQIEDRLWHGSIAGLLVLRSSVGAEFFGAKPLGEQQVEIAGQLKPDFQIEPKTMNNRTGPLYKFRPVAHLWAAHAHYTFKGRPAFPCSLDDLAGFLGTAEAIRVKAEATRLPRSQHTVMRPGEAVLLTASVSEVLPSVGFVPATFPETRP
jgi:hypothetical protein